MMLRNPELIQLLRVKSMIRYLPPKGTAGLARSAVNGWRRSPRPPDRIMVRRFFMRGCDCSRTGGGWQKANTTTHLHPFNPAPRNRSKGGEIQGRDRDRAGARGAMREG